MHAIQILLLVLPRTQGLLILFLCGMMEESVWFNYAQLQCSYNAITQSVMSCVSCGFSWNSEQFLVDRLVGVEVT